MRRPRDFVELVTQLERGRRRRAQLEIVLDQVLEADPIAETCARGLTAKCDAYLHEAAGAYDLQLAAKAARPYLAAHVAPKGGKCKGPRLTASLALHRLDEAIAAFDLVRS